MSHLAGLLLIFGVLKQGIAWIVSAVLAYLCLQVLFFFLILPACLPVPEEGVGSLDTGSVKWVLGTEPLEYSKRSVRFFV